MLSVTRLDDALISNTDVRQLEDRFGYSIPDEYRAFLLANNACEVMPCMFDCLAPGTGGEDIVREFFGIVHEPEYLDVSWQLKWTRGDMPDEWLPIAELACGCLLCIACGDRENGAIFYWDYYDRPEDNNEWYDFVYKIANSFSEFLELLRPERKAE